MIGALGVSTDAVADWLAHSGIAATSENDARTDPLFQHRIALDCEGVDRVGWLLLGPHPDEIASARTNVTRWPTLQSRSHRRSQLLERGTDEKTEAGPRRRLFDTF